jgi:hypothetical protein
LASNTGTYLFVDGSRLIHLFVQQAAQQNPDAALGGIIYGSDATHLTNYSGDVKVHALYASLGNISKEVRAQTSKRAWMLIAYIPICKWETTMEHTEFTSKSWKKALPGILTRRLFHYCMEIICEPLQELNTHEVVDPEGNIRLIFYVLIAYLADLEEQYIIAALDKSNCIHCEATTNKWGSPEEHPSRSSEDTLEGIKEVQRERGVNADPYQFALGANKYRLGDVEYPFWASLPFVEICDVLSVDLLHGFHKFFFDHPFYWNVNSLGEAEIDNRMKSQVPYVGAKMFPKGVSHISQMSGKEYRALQTVHLSVVANSSAKYSHELTLVTQALLDFLTLAQLPSQTEETLAAFTEAYNRFHELKGVWLKNGARRGEKDVMQHFNIPKLHTAKHMAEQILAKGTADNFSTETIEHLHMDSKQAYPATNKKEWEEQIIRWLARHEKLQEFGLFHAWRGSVSRTAAGGCGGNTGEGGAQGIEQYPGSQGEHLRSIVESPNLRIATVPHSNPAAPDGKSGSRHRRGGFALVPHDNLGPCTPPITPSSAPVVPTRKRKRVSNDEEDREERTSKRILQSQESYGLPDFQDIALRPVETLTMGAAQGKYGLTDLVDDYRGSAHLYSLSVTPGTVIDVWRSIRLQEPERRFFPKVPWRRAQAHPPADKQPPVADPVLYLKSETRGPSQVTLKGTFKLHAHGIC